MGRGKSGQRPESKPRDSELADRTTIGVPARGRGAATLNPGNRFESLRLRVLGDHLDESARACPGGRQVPTQVFADDSRTIINKVAPSPDIGFGWTINPYRGCEHGCIYCYARPSHEMLGFSCGLDFETKIMAKLDAAELLRRELASPRWSPKTIVMSGVTDCYQPVEAKLKITRACLHVLAECRQPVAVITKSHLVTRDIDFLGALARHGAARVAISITTLRTDLAAKMEPRASAPKQRLAAIRALTAAGIPVAVMTAPIIPGLNDQEMPAVLEAAAEAGAISAGWVMLRLPFQVKALFLDWLQREFPQRAARVEHHIRDVRNGMLNDPNFGSRMRGAGPAADLVASMFKLYSRRYGLDRELSPLSTASFRRPRTSGQLPLFE